MPTYNLVALLAALLLCATAMAAPAEGMEDTTAVFIWGPIGSFVDNIDRPWFHKWDSEDE